MKMNEEYVKPSGEKIAEWKRLYGSVYRIAVDGRECYLKPPSRKTLGYASVAARSNPLKFNEVLLNDCWLAGNEEIRQDDALFLSVGQKLDELLEVREATLEKL
jgi:hypothetical protein